MQEVYSKFKELDIETSWLGLSCQGNDQYFCTPVGAEIIGWDNGIHYCFIQGFGEMVFCVNPETCGDYYVYPLAKNFYDFLSLVLATRSFNAMQQIILWDKKTFENFISDPIEVEYAARKEVTDALNTIHIKLGVLPMENPFEYIKGLQKGFPYNDIKFTDEFYDVTGGEKYFPEK